MKWTDIEDLAIALQEAHAEVDPELISKLLRLFPHARPWKARIFRRNS